MAKIPSTRSPSTGETKRQAAIDFLLGRINYERVASLPYGQRHMKLDRMRQLLTRLGNPDAGMPIVHVAGTKGKGSTSTMLAGILHAAGYDAGLFSSPHLETIEERFAVNGRPCKGRELVALVEQLRPIVEEMDREAQVAGESCSGLTFFELTTAIALMHFKERDVDMAILEVGLGGRLDSTNVCLPIITVITSISLDHTKQLGSTLEQIAAEKAGIIKPGVPLLCGPLEAGPRAVISEIARERGCRMIEAGHDFQYEYRPPELGQGRQSLGRMNFVGEFGHEELRLDNIRLRLLGEHQAANAALAIAAAAKLRQQGWLLSSDSMRETFSKLNLPGRIELVRRDPAVLVDVAHNVASAEALARVLQSSFAGSERVLLLAASRDKDVRGIVRVLVPHFQRFVLTEYQDNPRAMPVAELRGLVREELTALGRDDQGVADRFQPIEALHLAHEWTGPDELLCITGSFFIVAELRSQVLGGRVVGGG